jgi:hypothetical protein
MNAATPTAAKPAPVASVAGLETVECFRCNGSGFHGPMCVWGGRCFGCGGAGRKYTRRGAAARKYLDELLSVPASTLVVGDRIRVSSITNGGEPFTVFSTILKIAPGVDDGCKRLDSATGEWHPVRGLGELRVETKTRALDVMPGDMVRKAWSAVAKATAVAAAVEYQATLTHAGTPRKR